MRIAATPRLFIQSPDMAEADLFAAWLNDPEVVKFSEQRHKKHTAESQKDYWTLNKDRVFTIYLAHVCLPIGSVSYQLDEANKIADVGIMIGAKSHWSRGYGFEAWIATCNYLFYAGIARKIEAGCVGANVAMRDIMGKFDMTYEGSRLGHFIINGKPENMLMYGKFGQ